ncbi:hypothetical protein F5X68DRAFT_216378 [Plectosphaerella plurivora]|uniref:Uncharacterized protein n=1 Tax=Plectosphaerella plurivora TaxID=936078 RepID=A0A9P8V0Q0_9PEZI|nr:hypothetical protein F5X68DRAFT_216378 [Plectosphaerella plurivora]
MYLPADFSLTVRSVSAEANVPQVICAWPLSGQYGFGSRILFYLLVTTCVFARKSLWLRNTFLAATLLFPVVAALHAIVLAVKHVDGAVDMDIYGAFQLCSLGLVAGTLAVRISKTYYGTPGRNTIFIWVTLILAGLLCLAVEFFRATPRSCPGFQYGKENSCDFICSEDEGPHSPLRQGAASDIYVVEAPTLLSFRAGVLLSAGCCVHAIVWMLYMLEKILREEERNRVESGESRLFPMLSHRTSSFAVSKRTPIKTRIILVAFGAVGLALLVVGERNFHSKPLTFEIELISGVGQWSSIVTAVLAAASSMLVPLHEDMARVREDRETGRHRNRRRRSRGYRVAEFFVDLDHMFDQRLKQIARRASTNMGEAEYPKLPGEEHRNPEISGLAAAVENFNRSRTPSVHVRRESNEGPDGGSEEGIVESPQAAHFRQDDAGFLAVPLAEPRRSGVHYGM